MACLCLKNQAEEEIDRLEKERKNYENAIKEIEEMVTIVNDYITFFNKVSGYLEHIIVNSKAFQQEGCNAQIPKLESVKLELENLKISIDTIIEQINDEIRLQKGIIRSGKICAKCAELLKKQNEQNATGASGNNTTAFNVAY